MVGGAYYTEQWMQRWKKYDAEKWAQWNKEARQSWDRQHERDDEQDRLSDARDRRNEDRWIVSRREREGD